MNYRSIYAPLVGLLLAGGLFAQQAAPPAQATAPPAAPTSRRGGGTIQGSVKDNTGGVIPGATVNLLNQSGTVQTSSSDATGAYVFHGVAPGSYTVTSSYTGMQQVAGVSINLTAGQQATANIAMTVQAQKQEVTVSDSVDNTVSTEASNNASQLVLKKEDLDALPDDPDDLEADLQALAGPSAGPGGGQIYIDGFTGGRLPPKASIREIRINSNPFSAEYDKLGYGRIQIFTKPGSDKFHGQGYYNISDGVWNTRNPFLSVNPPFRTQLFGGNVSGPLGKHASFFIDTERRQIDDNGIVTATIPTANFLGTTSLQNYYSTPQRRTTVSPRMDYQINANNTLSARYSYLDNNRVVTGIGAFNLPATTIGGIAFPSTGYSTPTTEQTVQLVETAVLSPKVVNETHFEFDHESQTWTGQSLAPELMVANAFISGGSAYSSAAYPHSYDLQKSFELQNYTSVTWGAHTTKFGVRVRSDILDDSSPKGFNGAYQFLGTSTMTSIQQYLGTVQRLQSGLSSAQVTALGYGPSKYTVTSGNPYIGLSQTDVGPFLQDEWRARPDLTLSLGVRWESQNNIPDHNDWAPRFGFAWSPHSKGGNSRPKTVIRGGWGMFYDRFAITNVEAALRYSQSNQVSYLLTNPTTYDATFSTPIPLASLSAATSAQKYQIDSRLQAPRLMQTAIGVERQIFNRTTLSVNFMNARGTHELRTVDINAPYPVVGQLPPGAVGGTTLGRPYGAIGDIYDYQSTGTYKQTQVLVNINTSVGKWLTLFGRYSWATAHSDTDGLGSLPSNPYNLAAEWGRASTDITNNFFLGGSISSKWLKLRFSPFIIARSGQPFNITTGTDLYLQGQTTARPSLLDPTLSQSVLGYNSVPLVSALGTSNIVQRNAGIGAGALSMNLRVSRTWGFGSTKFDGPSGGSRGGGGGGGGGGGRRGGGGGGGFGGGGGGGFGGESSEHRFNVTLSLNARNIINHENLNTFNGSLTSPYFFQGTAISGGFGPEATASNQRRLDLQLRFAF